MSRLAVCSPLLFINLFCFCKSRLTYELRYIFSGLVHLCLYVTCHTLFFIYALLNRSGKLQYFMFSYVLFLDI